MKPVKTAGTAAAVCSLAGVGLLPRLLDWGIDATHSAGMLLLAGLLWTAGKAVLSEKDRRLLRFSLAFGLVFAFCQLLGARLDSAGTVQDGMLLLLAGSLACAPAAGGLLLLLAKGTAGTATASKEDASTPRRTFWMTFAALLLCWLPYYLAYFPGMFNYDSAGEAAQFTTGQYNGAFPPLHTLLLAAFYRLGGAMGSYNAGIALYTAVQACTVAAALAYANAMLCRLGVKRGFRIGLATAYGLLPGFPLLVMSTTKDLFFCAALLPLLCLLAEGQREPKRLKKRGYAVAVVALTALSCLLRPNGVAAMAVALVSGWFLLPKEGHRRFGGAASVRDNRICRGQSGHEGGAASQQDRSAGAAQRAAGAGLPGVRPASENADRAGKGRNSFPDSGCGTLSAPSGGWHQAPYCRRRKHAAPVPAPVRTAAAAISCGFRGMHGRISPKGYWHLDDTTHLDIYAERADTAIWKPPPSPVTASAAPLCGRD